MLYFIPFVENTPSVPPKARSNWNTSSPVSHQETIADRTVPTIRFRLTREFYFRNNHMITQKVCAVYTYNSTFQTETQTSTINEFPDSFNDSRGLSGVLHAGGKEAAR